MLFDHTGIHLAEEENNLVFQPKVSDSKFGRNYIVFPAPAQRNLDVLVSNKYQLKLVMRRRSDGQLSRRKFDFIYVKHMPYCYLCYDDPDNLNTKNEEPEHQEEFDHVQWPPEVFVEANAIGNIKELVVPFDQTSPIPKK